MNNQISKTALFIFTLLFVQNMSFGQERTDITPSKWIRNPQAFEALKKDITQEYLKQAKLKAKFPETDTLDDGKVLKLDRVDINGQPQYLESFRNSSAAIVAKTDRARYNNGLAELDGHGITIGIWDETVALTTHQEFGGRVHNKDNGPETSMHSTHVSGTLIAAGVNIYAKGMAYKADLDGYDWNSYSIEMASAAASGLLLSNHSYGTHLTNSNVYLTGKYDYTASVYDQIAYNAPNYLMVKAAGNNRADSLNPIDNGYDLLTDGAVAKNTLVVGALTQDFLHPDLNPCTMSTYSNFGPTDDYRIKPDIVAPGNLYSTYSHSNHHYGWSVGTSMASPVVTGSAALLIQFANENHNTTYTSATIKGLLLHGAKDMGNPGPDFSYGWGLLNTNAAIEVMRAKDRFSRILENTLTPNAKDTLIVQSDGLNPMKVMLSWTDPKATVDYSHYTVSDYYQKTLVNDLDVRVYSTDSTYLPYAMDPILGNTQIAQRADNDIDNVECINIETLPAGEYTIVVSHKGSLTNNNQDYSLIVSGLENQNCLSTKSYSVDTLADSTLNLCWSFSAATNQTQLSIQSRTGTLDTVITTAGTDTSLNLDFVDYGDSLDVSIMNYTTGAQLDSSNTLSFSLKTPEHPCVQVDGLVVDSVTEHSVGIHWRVTYYDPATVYEIRYREVGYTSWITKMGTHTSLNAIIDHLNPQTNYELEIKGDCLGSNFQNNITFMTAIVQGGSLGLNEVSVKAFHKGNSNHIEVTQKKAQEEVILQKMNANQFTEIADMTNSTEFEDHNLTGAQSIYRVKVSNGGETKYSQPIIVDHEISGDGYRIIRRASSIDIINYDFNIINCHLVSLDGKVILSKKVEKNEAANIDLKNYSGEIYILQLRNNSQNIKTIKVQSF